MKILAQPGIDFNLWGVSGRPGNGGGGNVTTQTDVYISGMKFIATETAKGNEYPAPIKMITTPNASQQLYDGIGDVLDPSTLAAKEADEDDGEKIPNDYLDSDIRGSRSGMLSQQFVLGGYIGQDKNNRFYDWDIMVGGVSEGTAIQTSFPLDPYLLYNGSGFIYAFRGRDDGIQEFTTSLVEGGTVGYVSTDMEQEKPELNSGIYIQSYQGHRKGFLCIHKQRAKELKVPSGVSASKKFGTRRWHKNRSTVGAVFSQAQELPREDLTSVIFTAMVPPLVPRQFDATHMPLLPERSRTFQEMSALWANNTPMPETGKRGTLYVGQQIVGDIGIWCQNSTTMTVLMNAPRNHELVIGQELVKITNVTDWELTSGLSKASPALFISRETDVSLEYVDTCRELFESSLKGAKKITYRESREVLIARGEKIPVCRYAISEAAIGAGMVAGGILGGLGSGLSSMAQARWNSRENDFWRKNELDKIREKMAYDRELAMARAVSAAGKNGLSMSSGSGYGSGVSGYSRPTMTTGISGRSSTISSSSSTMSGSTAPPSVLSSKYRAGIPKEWLESLPPAGEYQPQTFKGYGFSGGQGTSGMVSPLKTGEQSLNSSRPARVLQKGTPNIGVAMSNIAKNPLSDTNPFRGTR
jgi:hypothetical protein